MISEELIKLENLEVLSGLDLEQMTKKMQLVNENLKLLNQEETYWLNRSHE